MSSIISEVRRADSTAVDIELLLGLKGDTGKSAYAYAVEMGYAGTEEEFTTLMGRLTTAADEAEASAEAAQEALNEFVTVTATAETLPAGSDATASYVDGELTFGIPKGDKGDQGDPYDDSVIVARMDSFTNLAEGSTTGDAELIDGRVGADGVTYTNIGGAIRGQIADLKSDFSELKEYVGVKDYGLLSGYVFEKASGNTTVTVVDTQTGVQLTKSDAVNANCRFRPTSWVKGQYNVKGSFSSGLITQLCVYENGSLITTIPVTDKEFSFAYEWDGSKRVQFGFQYPYNVGTLLFELNVYDAVSLADKIDNIGDIPFIIGETNTFFGVGAGENTSENEVDEPDDGRYNAAFGTEAMKANTTGDHCTAVGYKALAKNTSGDSNTGVGEDALYENTTGEYNVAVGGHALQNNNGNSNVAVGSNAGRNVSTGTGNVIIGSQAGQNVIGGSQNVLIGSYVGQGAGDYSDTVVIGNDINPSANHQMKIGGSNITSFVVRMNNKNMLLSFNQDGTITWSQL